MLAVFGSVHGNRGRAVILRTSGRQICCSLPCSSRRLKQVQDKGANTERRLCR